MDDAGRREQGFPVRKDRRPPALARPAARRAALLALLLLAAVPAAAQARTFKVDGRVTGPPTARGGAAVVPLQLTKRAGRALKLGTRSVRVRLSGRARLPLSGAGAAGASVLAPRALRAGDRLRGLSSLSNRARRRLRYHYRPTLRLRRASVIRAGTRAPDAPARPAGPPPPAASTAPGTPASPSGPPPPAPPPPPPGPAEQIVKDIWARATALSGRVGYYGSARQQNAALSLHTLSLPVGLAGLTGAFQELKTALEARSSTDPALNPLLADVEALAPRAEWLEAAMRAGSSTGWTARVLRHVNNAIVENELPSMAQHFTTQIALLQHVPPGVMTQLTALAETLARIEDRLDALEAALGSLDPRVSDLNTRMASLTNAINALATAVRSGADLASVSAGVDALVPDVAGLDSGFGALRTSVTELSPLLGGLEGDALTVLSIEEALDSMGLNGG
jgi:hypothetical protein